MFYTIIYMYTKKITVIGELTIVEHRETDQ